MKEGQWVITKDNDDWMNAPAYDNRAVAIAQAQSRLRLVPGERFWVGQASRAATWCTADTLVDALDNHALNEAPDGSDGYSISADARKELGALLEFWAHKHDVKPLWFDVEDVTEHVVPSVTAVQP